MYACAGIDVTVQDIVLEEVLAFAVVDLSFKHALCQLKALLILSQLSVAFAYHGLAAHVSLPLVLVALQLGILADLEEEVESLGRIPGLFQL